MISHSKYSEEVKKHENTYTKGHVEAQRWPMWKWAW